MSDSADRKPDEVLDTCGLKCPLPVLKARKRLKALAPGQRLELRADDPAAIIDVPFYCDESGHKLVHQHEDSGILIFVLERS